jgi:hypothetical protein
VADTKTIIEFLRDACFERMEWDESEMVCYRPDSTEPFGPSEVKLGSEIKERWQDLEIALSGHPEFKLSLKDFRAEPKNAEIANSFIAQGWEVLPPAGCIVRARIVSGDLVTAKVFKRDIDPDEETVLFLDGTPEYKATLYCDPADIKEVVSTPANCLDAQLWWRRPKEHD